MTVAFWQLSPPPPTPPNPPPPPLTADTPNPYARTASPSNQAVQDIASEHPQIGVNIGPRSVRKRGTRGSLAALP
ncbi:hypothetical protein J6590_091738 [Homalodisca vitripennis]|nr:hypothetical protein J6590_091738 [Homalodisca vitripennis]